MPQKPVIVFAAGCFNRIHKAHLRMLQTARSLGERLIVVLSHDLHNKKPNAVPASLRRARVKALGVADQVIIGEPNSFARSLRLIKPDILVLGYDQKLPDDETKRTIKELGIEIVVLPWFPGKEETLSLLGQ